MGKILFLTGCILCLAGMAALLLAVVFFKKQREKLIDQINNEYREV
ncbi:MAG: hypothetical protein HFI43_04225 [Lachnospiraceae bacterium]|jgi:hypothetical protein|nr:hypothetical protein [Lachnospiraceae bacterium]GFI16442.1 hypothetical protein IMSAGC009_01607 [Lachnospiraceae bacterium]